MLLKTPRFKASLGENGEEAFHGIQPRGRGWCEVKCEARMPRQPGDDFRVLMRGIVIEDHMDDLASLNLGFNLVEEADELLMPVPLHALPDDRSIEHVESGKERVVPCRL